MSFINPTKKNNTCKNEKINFFIEKPLALKLKNMANKNETTLFNLLISAFSILISNYTSQDDFVIASPTTGREGPGAESIVGFFVNILLLQFSLSPNISFKEYLKKNHQYLIDVFKNQNVPFEKLIQTVNPGRDSRGGSLARIMFAFQNFYSNSLSLSKLGIEPYFSDNRNLFLSDLESSKFDLTVYMQEEDGIISGLIEYEKSMFDENISEGLARQFICLLNSVAENEGEKIFSLEYLSGREKNTLMYDWNNNSIVYPKESLLEMFSRVVDSCSSKAAIIHGDISITYDELDKKSNRLANLLITHTAKKRCLISTLLDKGIDFVIAILAIIKADCYYLPIDPNNPSSRIKYILDDSRARLLVTADSLLKDPFSDMLAKCQCDIISLSNIDFSSPKPPELLKQSPQNSAYVIYTSGTTGNPKGVEISLGSLTNLVYWHKSEYKVIEKDNVSVVSSPGFDASVWEIWPYLTSGSTLYISDYDNLLDPQFFIRWLFQNEINITFLPTAIAELVLAQDLSHLTNLRLMLTGGDQLKTYPKVDLPFKLYNHYGPTEATVVTTQAEIINARGSRPLPEIGKPISNVKILILNKHNNLVPPGVSGEIYIAGEGLAKGYLNKKILTSEKFLSLENFNQVAPLFYKTGDLATWLPNGSIEYRGRNDSQVKIRGFRVELVEIEQVMLKFPSVKQAYVLLDNNTSDKSLIGFVSASRKNLNLDRFRDYLKKSLPGYMIPKIFPVLGRLPVTKNGKVDKKALLDLLVENLRVTGIQKEIKTGTQDFVLSTYASTLKVEASQIHLDNNFFDLGGHSLNAIQIISKINDKYNLNLNVGVMFEAPTPRDLSCIIDDKLYKPAKIRSCVAKSPRSASLIPLNTLGENPAIFLVHPVGGTVFNYVKLAKHLGEKRSCYAIQDPGVNLGPLIFSNIQEMASFYIKLIKDVQPHGPYILGGHSFGGMVAFEMANQLLEMGEAIQTIVLLDTWAISNAESTSRSKLMQKIYHDHELTKNNLKGEASQEKEFWAILNYHRIQNIGLNYHPPKLACHITLLKAKFLSSEFKAIDEPSNFWSSYSYYPIKVIGVLGDHESILNEPYVSLLARKLISIFKKSSINCQKSLTLTQNLQAEL